MSQRDDDIRKIQDGMGDRLAKMEQDTTSNKKNTDSINENTKALDKNTESRKENTEQTGKSITQKAKEDRLKEKLEAQAKRELQKLRELNIALADKANVQSLVEAQRKKEIESIKKMNQVHTREVQISKFESAINKKRQEQRALDIKSIEKEAKTLDTLAKEGHKADAQQIKILTNARKELEAVRRKAISQNEKEKKQLESLRLQREKNKEVLRNLNVIAKQHGITLKDLTGNLDLVKRAVKGDVRAMGQLKRAMREATKQGTVLNEKLGILSVRSQRNVGGAFSVLRSKLLLASFGFSVTAGNVLKLISAYGQQERAEKSLATALESTNYSSGQTASSLIEYAGTLQKATGVTDELIIESSALLATFTQISGDVFTRTQNSILDVTIAMNQGNVTTETLKTSTIQLGKALNDPVKGLSALSRVGIQFSKDQKELIKNFVKMGDITSAQNMILDEMDVQFGGMSETFRQTAEGSLMALNSAFGDLQERMGAFLAHAGVVNVFNGLANALDRINPSNIANIGASIGIISLALSKSKIVLGVKALGAFFKTASSGQVVRGMSKLATASKGLSMAVKGFGILSLVGGVTILLDMLNLFKSMDVPVDRLNKRLEKVRENMIKINDSQVEQRLNSLKKELDSLPAPRTADIKSYKQAWEDAEKGISSGINLSADAIEKRRKELEIEIEYLEGRMEAITGKRPDLALSIGVIPMTEFDMQKNIQSMLQQTKIARVAQKEAELEFIDTLIGENEASEAMLELRGKLEIQLDTLINKTDKYGNSIKDLKNEEEKAFDSSKLLEAGVTSVANALSDVIVEGKNLKELDLGKILLKSLLSTGIGMGVDALMGSLFPPASVVGHSGGQVPKYHSGGLAQNEVPAILEQGEFVVRREAVDSVGLETLNRINQSGSTGSVNISFAGNVLSQDFIEDEAIPMIKEAVRRGADIGVS